MTISNLHYLNPAHATVDRLFATKEGLRGMIDSFNQIILDVQYGQDAVDILCNTGKHL